MMIETASSVIVFAAVVLSIAFTAWTWLLLRQQLQHEPDEHAQWLGADAGGAVNHHNIGDS